ncbi:DUF6481 family protein [Methylobacterium oryzihabitans]|nr:DUF6481 family protein [Methylobacterium oryzihabitans]
MASFQDVSLGDRLTSSGSARDAMLLRFKARPAGDDPAVAARRAARRLAGEARHRRLTERDAARRAEAARTEAEALRLREREEADRARDAAEAIARAGALEAEQKAARDARYAARKARRRA